MPESDEGVERPGHGFVWHELRTSDPAAAVDFYTALFGWTSHAVRTESSPATPGGSGPVSPAGAGSPAGPESPAGEGLVELRSPDSDLRIGTVRLVDPGRPPGWSAYLWVGDLDASLTALAGTPEATGGLGARVVAEARAQAYPEGRIATVEHPAVAELELFHGTGGNVPVGQDTQPGDPGPGFGWHRLETPEPTAAAVLLDRLARWNAAPTAVDGTALLRRRSGRAGATPRAYATLTTAPTDLPAHWLSYVRVHSIRETLRRATELGALVVTEQALVPPIGPTCVIRDHDGVSIGAYEP